MFSNPYFVPQLTVLVASSSPLVLIGWETIVGKERDLTIVATVDAGDKILGTTRMSYPMVVVIDEDIARGNALEIAQSISSAYPDCGIVLFARTLGPGSVTSAARAGVDCYVTWNASRTIILQAIRSAALKETMVDPLVGLHGLQDAVTPLSTRQQEVLRLAAEGYSVEETGSILFLSAGTVRNHLASAVTRLSARNRLDAVRIAVGTGWI